MKVGYCVPIAPQMASFRLRVAIPAPHLGCDYEIGCTGNPSFFYKHYEGDLELATSCGEYVYDVVNDHFAGKLGEHYRAMCASATAITVASETMADTVQRYTGREAVVIPDPWENEEDLPRCAGNEVTWFGHLANIKSLYDAVERIADMPILLNVCSNYKHPDVLEWSPDMERRALNRAAVVLVTGNSPGASANRIIKALRAGRFVVTPGGAPAWEEFKDYIWIGDVHDGIEWAMKNGDEACTKITQGQHYLRERFSPQTIATKWMELFVSTLAPVTSDKRDGSALTTPQATASS
jgi:hypothetical protein